MHSWGLNASMGAQCIHGDSLHIARHLNVVDTYNLYNNRLIHEMKWFFNKQEVDIKQPRSTCTDCAGWPGLIPLAVALTLYHTIPTFYTSGKEGIWKHCGKRSKCWYPAFSPLCTFSTLESKQSSHPLVLTRKKLVRGSGLSFFV